MMIFRKNSLLFSFDEQEKKADVILRVMQTSSFGSRRTEKKDSHSVIKT
jgi:hypothetical protein